jgi:hypothetical protein
MALCSAASQARIDGCSQAASAETTAAKVKKANPNRSFIKVNLPYPIGLNDPKSH